MVLLICVGDSRGEKKIGNGFKYLNYSLIPCIPRLLEAPKDGVI